MCKEVCYDRGNKFYCPDCGFWIQIKFRIPEHVGIADFDVASLERSKYKKIFSTQICKGIDGEPGVEGSGKYHCKPRLASQEIKQ